MKRQIFKWIVRNPGDRGWTFLETLIVLAILLVLSGGVSFAGLRYLERAKVVSARNDVSALSLAVESYRLDTGDYPSDLQGLPALWKKPLQNPVPANWLGPYVDRAEFIDPWGNPYGYGAGGILGYQIISYGSDGVEGGSGTDEDITSGDIQ